MSDIPEAPNNYIGKQVIINSDRLLFNAKDDSLLVYSNKHMAFSANNHIHFDTGDEFSYHKFNNGQWLDYSGGLIFGWKANKNLGFFLEGKYNKYWNRNWYDFKVGVNYVII